MRDPHGRSASSQARLERVSDHLPPAAEARLAEIRRSGTWGSALTSDEFASVRSVGFQPVGQVLGAAVYNVGYTGGYGCPGAWGGYNFGWGPVGRTEVSSRGGYGSFGPMVKTLYEARRAAISRMVAECVELGGHGVVGVRLTIGPFPTGGLEFKAIGTAVRAPLAPPLRHPFTSDLSGQDFAKLVHTAGCRRARLGITVAARHDDWQTVGQTRWSAGNAEVTGWTELVMTPGTTRGQLARRRQAHRRRGGVSRTWTCGCASASARRRRAAATTSSRRSTSVTGRRFKSSSCRTESAVSARHHVPRPAAPSGGALDMAKTGVRARR